MCLQYLSGPTKCSYCIRLEDDRNRSICFFTSKLHLRRFSVLYSKPTKCNSGSNVFINNCRYAVHVSDALYVHHQEQYKL